MISLNINSIKPTGEKPNQVFRFSPQTFAYLLRTTISFVLLLEYHIWDSVIRKKPPYPIINREKLTPPLV